MAVQNIEGCYEELMGILLLVARQVSGVGPDEVQQLVEDQRRLVAAVELLEQPGDLTDEAARRVIVELTHVFV